ncbi:U32 family peptidase [Romboutsia maritimum]|uniref:U32 family peptidase n=1 Tax=Romboutsia maritimum TaxID=2020948 RepID=A0A371IWH1_9FIRM|nr:U32 family peptidase [Romboutsia maritimum]RDY24822.1 U32 family peptidase [Romboutsia maritimum]
MHKAELLAPAGDLERLKIAITYGADAVYIGGEYFGMRSSARNFTKEEMKEGIDFAHEKGKKVYVTVNVIPHNNDFLNLEEYLLELQKLGVDAFILADAGVLDIVKRVVPDMEIHLSTQANTTNYVSANFWHNQGIKRIAMARELSCEEISEIRAKTPLDMDIEVFVHGAMCISNSGRCLISNYMESKDVNQKSFAQADKSNYSLVEEKRPGEYYPIYEDERGTFFFNSKDLCMIEYLPELIKSGITSLKIEGRMKSSYYIASVVRAYRMAIDAFYEDSQNWTFNPLWLEEIQKSSHRHFTTGFYLEKPGEEEQNCETTSYVRSYDFIGIVKGIEAESGLAIVEQRNIINVGDDIEVFGPYKETMFTKIEEMYDEDGESIQTASHPNQIIKVKLSGKVDKDYMLRREMQDDK